MKLRCAGVTKITQVIVTSCYIANNNFTFFKIYRQVKVLISGSEYLRAIKRPFQRFGRRRWGGGGSDVGHDIDGQPLEEQLFAKASGKRSSVITRLKRPAD